MVGGAGLGHTVLGCSGRSYSAGSIGAEARLLRDSTVVQKHAMLGLLVGPPNLLASLSSVRQVCRAKNASTVVETHGRWRYGALVVTCYCCPRPWYQRWDGQHQLVRSWQDSKQGLQLQAALQPWGRVKRSLRREGTYKGQYAKSVCRENRKQTPFHSYKTAV